MIARGKREARRPWWKNKKGGPALKGRNTYFGLSGLDLNIGGLTRGDALASLSLAPGYHISRLRRCARTRAARPEFFAIHHTAATLHT